MKFSVRVQYGLQALLDLALNYGGGPVQIAGIAGSQKIPVRYLEQLLLVLKRRGLVSSMRGKEGGYSLAKHPADISMLDLIEAFEGPVEFTSKRLKRVPVLFEVFENIQESLKDQLKSTTIENLIFKKRQKDRAYMYNI